MLRSKRSRVDDVCVLGCAVCCLCCPSCWRHSPERHWLLFFELALHVFFRRQGLPFANGSSRHEGARRVALPVFSHQARQRGLFARAVKRNNGARVWASATESMRRVSVADDERAVSWGTAYA